jgi:hypothetical protein
MSRKQTFAVALTVVMASAGSVRAADTFELSQDDGATTHNLMRHGDRQVHDLEGAPPAFDQDWIRVFTQARHSYEARVTGSYWDLPCGVPPCPLFARVNSGATVLTAGSVYTDDVPNTVDGIGLGMTVRWTAAADGGEYLRAMGDQFVPLGPVPYSVLFRDTTLLVPRWNSSGSQTTVLVLQNGQRDAITGLVHFYNAAGALVQSVGISVPPYGVNVLNTGSLPALAGLSGSAQVSHDGGFGGLGGKAVALEPSTGFTFDTVMAPIPY